MNREDRMLRASHVDVDGTRYVIPGDLARVEADGSVTLLGRGSQSINSGGEKIFPEEVEAAVKSHPAVYDAVVVGVPDERWGQRVAAEGQLAVGVADVARRDSARGGVLVRRDHALSRLWFGAHN